MIMITIIVIIKTRWNRIVEIIYSSWRWGRNPNRKVTFEDVGRGKSWKIRTLDSGPKSSWTIQPLPELFLLLLLLLSIFLLVEGEREREKEKERKRNKVRGMEIIIGGGFRETIFHPSSIILISRLFELFRDWKSRWSHWLFSSCFLSLLPFFEMIIISFLFLHLEYWWIFNWRSFIVMRQVRHANTETCVSFSSSSPPPPPPPSSSVAWKEETATPICIFLFEWSVIWYRFHNSRSILPASFRMISSLIFSNFLSYLLAMTCSTPAQFSSANSNWKTINQFPFHLALLSLLPLSFFCLFLKLILLLLLCFSPFFLLICLFLFGFISRSGSPQICIKCNRLIVGQISSVRVRSIIFRCVMNTLLHLLIKKKIYKKKRRNKMMEK